MTTLQSLKIPIPGNSNVCSCVFASGITLLSLMMLMGLLCRTFFYRLSRLRVNRRFANSSVGRPLLLPIVAQTLLRVRQGRGAELVAVALPERTCRRQGAHPLWRSIPPLPEIGPRLRFGSCWRTIMIGISWWLRLEFLCATFGSRCAEKWISSKGISAVGRGRVKNAVELCGMAERVFVLMDSDRTSVGGEEDTPQRQIRTLAHTRPNVLPFILAKREIENYIPAVVWEDVVEQHRSLSLYTKYEKDVERANKLRAWKRLSDAEKDVADLETFFSDAKAHVSKLCDPLLVPTAVRPRRGKTGRENGGGGPVGHLTHRPRRSQLSASIKPMLKPYRSRAARGGRGAGATKAGRKGGFPQRKEDTP